MRCADYESDAVELCLDAKEGEMMKCTVCGCDIHESQLLFPPLAPDHTFAVCVFDGNAALPFYEDEYFRSMGVLAKPVAYGPGSPRDKAVKAMMTARGSAPVTLELLDIKCSNPTCQKMNNMGDKKCWNCEGRL